MPFDPSQPTTILEEPPESASGFDPSKPTEILEEPESKSVQTYIPAPGEQTRTVRSSVLAGPTQAFPVAEGQRADAQANPVPELSAGEAEQMLTTPQVSVPREPIAQAAAVGIRGLGNPALNAVVSVLGGDKVINQVSQGLAELGAGLVEQSAATPAAPLLALATAVPGVRVAAGALLSAAAAKGAAQKLGEASVTGNPQTITEGVGQAVLAGLGAAGTGLDVLKSVAPATAEAVKAAGETLTPPKIETPQAIPEIPLGMHRIATADPALRVLTESELTSEHRANTALVDKLEKIHDQRPLSVAERNELGRAQDLYTSSGLEIYRRYYEDISTYDVYRELTYISDSFTDPTVADLGREDFRKFEILTDILSKRKGFDQPGELAANLGRSPDTLEVAKGRNEKISQLLKLKNDPGQVGVLPSPGPRPLGIVSSITPGFTGLRDLITGATEEGRMFLRGAAGESLPKMVSANSEAAEAGVSMASARTVSPLKAELFVEKALEGTGIDPVRAGAAITEDNLRDVRDQRIAAGEDPATVEVNTVIGKRGSPFPDEASYQAFLESPETKQAVEQYKQLWTEIKEPQYRLAASIDPETPLATRGKQTGARINLFALKEGEPVPEGTRIAGGGGGGNLLATLRRKSPFARAATGEGDRYVIDLRDIMANSFDREYAIAMKNKMDNLLVEKGDAVVSAPGKKAPELVKGEKAVAFPYRNLNVVAEDSGVIPLSRNLYLRQSLAKEYRALAGVDAPGEIPILTKQVGERLTRAALAGLSEGTIHVSNLMTGLFTRPGPTSSLLVNSLLKATGRADVPVTLTKTVLTAFKDNRQQLLELAELGALKERYGGGPMAKILTKVDQAVRLTLDNTYRGLAEKGVVENTPAARREFINQVGQYNKRLQGPVIRYLRETQLGPFATAGRAFNVLGYRTMTGSPGVRATGIAGAAALRAEALAGWVGAFGLAATYNYLTTGRVGGSPGTRLGDLDLGVDESGKHRTFPMADLLGYGRALRATGVRGIVESKRIGLTDATAVQRGFDDAVSSALNPALGPALRTAFMAVTGKRMAVPAVQEAPLEPPQSETPQVVRNIEHALLEANPIVASIYELKQGRPMGDILQRQLTRFAPRSAPTSDLIEALPRIVDKRQMEDYLDDVARRARKLTPKAATGLFDSAAEALDKLEDPRLRKEGKRILKGKRRFVE